MVVLPVQTEMEHLELVVVSFAVRAVPGILLLRLLYL